MSVDFNAMSREEPGLGESGTPMFAPVPAWERNRKRRGFGGKARSAVHEDRVAVGLRLGDDVGADVAAGARVILDHHRLAPLARQLLADEARGDVRRAARGERHDDPYRA